jgi:DNA-binding NarL/FixJ family response regulator
LTEGKKEEVPVRLLIVEDEDMLRETLAGIVRGDQAFKLVATATNADEAIVMADQFKPDVALVDVNVPGGGGVRATVGIRTASPLTRVLAVSPFTDPDAVSQMLQAGALGYFLKGTAPKDLLAGLRRAAEGVLPTLTGELTRDGETAPLNEQEAEERWRSRWLHRGDHIRRIIEGDRLSSVYQPILALRNRDIAGAEALARFGQDSPNSPARWFTEADDADLLPELELEAIRRALSAVDLLPPTAFLSVNLSPRTILTGAVEGLLTDELRGRLVVEVADHAPVPDYAAFARAMAPLRAAGTRLAVACASC